MLWLTTGAGTLERLLASASGESASLPGLTREVLARDVLGTSEQLMGAYFSFDGLLHAVQNRNLPGGATRYLAQMFELAVRIDSQARDTRIDVLVTR